MAKPYVMDGVALVTGAASGIGRAVAKTFIEEGVTRIIIADLNDEGLQETATQLAAMGDEITVKVVKTDTSNQESIQNMVDQGVDAFGAIHYCVNCAGISTPVRTRTTELDVEHWDRVVNVNLRGVWLCMRSQIAQMLKQAAGLSMRVSGVERQRGAIVNVSSIAGLVGIASSGGYSASKHGVIGLSKVDAASYGKDGIRVNTVCPGNTDTPMIKASQAKGAKFFELNDTTALPRMGRPEEIAQVCVFLASTRASYMTGEEVIVDGGMVKLMLT